MGQNLKHTELTKPIINLSFSDRFKKMAEVNGFETLEEILSFNIASLMKRPGFSMHAYLELYRFLEKEGCSDQLKIE